MKGTGNLGPLDGVKGDVNLMAGKGMSVRGTGAAPEGGDGWNESQGMT